MTDNQTERAKSIFLEAIENNKPDQWPSYLDEACGDDAQLRSQVEQLLKARRDMGRFHESPESQPTVIGEVSETVGAQIGPYKLREQLGEGGFGVVYVAEQTKPVRRKVALKIIKPGMNTKEVVARFEAERQALALMDHPNIASQCLLRRASAHFRSAHERPTRIDLTGPAGIWQFEGSVIPNGSQADSRCRWEGKTVNRDRTTTDSETTSMDTPKCQCGGPLRLVDENGTSRTVRCTDCGHCSLVLGWPETNPVIFLRDFHFKRGDAADQRPFSDLTMATRLVRCLDEDAWPARATVTDFGIESDAHLGALQHAARCGRSAYDFDRVMGDGPAITRLVRSVPEQPFGRVEFRTPYDNMVDLIAADK